MSDPSSTIAGSSPGENHDQQKQPAAVHSTTNGDHNAQAGPSTPTPSANPNGDVTMKEDAANGDDAAQDTNGEPDVSQLFAARRQEELARRDRSLAEFLVMLDGYKPLIPDEVTEYYLQRSGFDCSDPRLKRLLSLSAQKFISDLSRDAYHFAKLRMGGATAGRGRPTNVQDRNRVVLTMDDLSLALGEHGVNVKKPDYYL